MNPLAGHALNLNETAKFVASLPRREAPAQLASPRATAVF